MVKWCDQDTRLFLKYFNIFLYIFFLFIDLDVCMLSIVFCDVWQIVNLNLSLYTIDWHVSLGQDMHPFDLHDM